MGHSLTDTLRRIVLLLGLGLAMALSVSGCDKTVGNNSSQFSSGMNLTGADYAKGFNLSDFDGKTRTLQEFRGKVVLVFFGFVQCPDVCPTTLMEMAQVKKALGADADKVQVIFITVDPERDTPEILKAYVNFFDDGFIALIPKPHELVQIARDFRVYYKKVPIASADNYTMDHTAGSYVFDTQGQLRLLTRYGTGTDSLVKDIRLLLDERK